MTVTVVFYDESFPFDGERPSALFLEEIKKTGTIADADNLSVLLSEADCFITLHGPYFPKGSWNAVLHYLKTGKGFIHTGGEPFKHPVRKEKSKWTIETAQTAYHQELHIHETQKISDKDIKSFTANADIPLFEKKESLFSVQPSFALTLHITKAKDLPRENGSGGPMDAHLYPLLSGLSKDGRNIAAPAVLLENTKGVFTGGRWLFINQQLTSSFWNEKGAAALNEWASYCACGVTEIWLKTNYATYYEGERPRLLIQLQSLRAHETNWSLTCSIKHAGSSEEWKGAFTCSSGQMIKYENFPIEIDIKPGKYHLRCTAVSDTGEKRIFHHGFWGYDESLLKDGSPLSCDRDYFRKDGKPFPIIGMTYMTSDVARKYLFLPNVHIWDQDMEQMKNVGINYLRTGLWTGWRQVMFVDGHPHEEVMRAIDAFFLTAKKHGLEVTFNFFSFTPEAWEGENPYLDPRSVEAQKRFISAIVSRHKASTHVQWDLINEPSMFDPERIFQGPRSSGDTFELHAFQSWLKERHRTVQVLQEHWNMTPSELPDFNAVRLPEQQEINFSTTDKQSRKGNRWLDYSLFTMCMHNKWAKELTSAIKEIAPNQLVTVGQDEALGGKRPSPFFYAEAVDYTTVHSWWLLDHLVWDSLFTKDPYKPNLVQETGIMHVDRPDGRSKRSEEETKYILERKYAYAFATGGAGAVQWLWNTNHYMDNINESNIGALRSDGTEKPEADISYGFGTFIGEASHLFEGRELEDVAVVYPYSNDFSNRAFAFASTAKLTRILNYDMKVPFRGIGEYHLHSLQENPPKLIIVPSPHNFSRSARQYLLHHIKTYGGTLLWTGPLHLDEYWRSRPSGDDLWETSPANVLREERLQIGSESYPVSFLTDQQMSVTFGKNRLGELEKELIDRFSDHESAATALSEKRLGKGKIIWSPLPVELNNRDEPLLALYAYVLKESAVPEEIKWIKGKEWIGIYGRKLTFNEGHLYVFVSEDAHHRDLEIEDPATSCSYAFTIERDRSVLFATDKKGGITAIYRPDEVNILRQKI